MEIKYYNAIDHLTEHTFDNLTDHYRGTIQAFKLMIEYEPSEVTSQLEKEEEQRNDIQK